MYFLYFYSFKFFNLFCTLLPFIFYTHELYVSTPNPTSLADRIRDPSPSNFSS